MTTFIILTLAALAILAMLGAALTFTWLCALTAGRVVGWVMGVEPGTPANEAQDDLLSPQRIAQIDALVASSQHMLRKSEQRALLLPRR